MRDSRADVTIAAVVAGSSKDYDRASSGPQVADGIGERVTGARHEFVSRNAAHLDRLPIELAHLSCRVDRARWRVHRLIIINAG
jgi:hypothetical protein